MVAVIEPAVASKNRPAAIRGLALEPVRNGDGIETMWFGPGRHVIGSSAECSHSLLTAGVQPRHCEIRLEAGHATLRALDFRTWLNNGPVRQAELRAGDRLIVGPLEFRVSLEAAASCSRDGRGSRDRRNRVRGPVRFGHCCADADLDFRRTRLHQLRPAAERGDGRPLGATRRKDQRAFARPRRTRRDDCRFGGRSRQTFRARPRARFGVGPTDGASHRSRGRAGPDAERRWRPKSTSWTSGCGKRPTRWRPPKEPPLRLWTELREPRRIRIPPRPPQGLI